MTIRRRAAIAVTLLGLAVGVGAAPPDPTAAGLDPAARVEALVARVTAAQRATRSLRARFEQRRESELLIEPEEARGVFSFVAPDRVRWEYEAPRPMTVVVRGEEMTTWFRDLGRAERANVGKYSNQVLRYLGASGSFESLKQYFDLTFAFPKTDGEPYRVELAPRLASVARRIGGMTLWIDRQTYLVSRLRIVAADGDSTEFAFREIEMNPTLADSHFELRLPPDVEVKTVTVGPKSKPSLR